MATALPGITGELGGLRHLSWVVTAVVVTTTASALSYAAMAWATQVGIDALPIKAVLVVTGLGISLVMPNLTATHNGLARSELGVATATAVFFRSLGGALDVALSGTLLAMHLQLLPAGLSHTFTGGAIIAGLGPLTVLFLAERPMRCLPALAPYASLVEELLPTASDGPCSSIRLQVTHQRQPLQHTAERLAVGGRLIILPVGK